MSKQAKIFLYSLMLALFAACVPAYACVFESVKNIVSAEFAALLISAVAAVLAGISGVLYTKAVRTFKEAGEFLTTLSIALEDKRITRDELAQIIREGRDIFMAWK